MMSGVVITRKKWIFYFHCLPQPLKIEKSREIGKIGKRFKTAWTQYELASVTNEKDEPIRVAAFLYISGDQALFQATSGTIQKIRIIWIKSSKSLTKTTKKKTISFRKNICFLEENNDRTRILINSQQPFVL